jgi:diguanylate cyclase (GGDEF)-like protein
MRVPARHRIVWVDAVTERRPDVVSDHDQRFAGFAAACAAAAITMFVLGALNAPAADRAGQFVIAFILAATLAIALLFFRRGFAPRALLGAGATLILLGVAAAGLLQASLDGAVILPLAGAVLALPAARGRFLLAVLIVAYAASMVGVAILSDTPATTVPGTAFDTDLSFLETGVMLGFAYGLLWWVGDRWWRADDQARRALANQGRLLAVSERLLSNLDSSGVFEMIADSLKAVLAYDNLTIYRVDRTEGVLRPVLARDRFAQLIIDSTFPMDMGVTGWVVAHGTAQLVNDVLADPRAATIPGTPDDHESLIVVPLLVDGEVAGTLNVGRMGEKEAYFSAEDFEVARLFAGQASIALRNAETLRVVAARAETDALTGLRNRGAFDERLAALIADPTSHPLVMVMLDLDGFKHFNDVNGHPAGDALLQETARAITASVRDGDLGFRYGGDEFALLLPKTDSDSARQIAERIRLAVASVGSSGSFGVTASVGIGDAPRDARSAESLVQATDAALYRAKGSGGDRVQTWRETRALSGGRPKRHEAGSAPTTHA